MVINHLSAIAAAWAILVSSNLTSCPSTILALLFDGTTADVNKNSIGFYNFLSASGAGLRLIFIHRFILTLDNISVNGITVDNGRSIYLIDVGISYAGILPNYNCDIESETHLGIHS